MRRKSSLLSQQIEALAKKKVKKKAEKDELIPSGSTMLNLACSDDPSGAFVLGRIVTLPGGSASGKTMLMLTMLAECARNKRFDDYDFIYDDGEETFDGFNIEYLFGEALSKRISPPGVDENGKPLHSGTIQDFKASILTRMEKERPCIYILDSLDSLTSDEELRREYNQALVKAKTPEAVQELKGSYKTEKAKAIGETLRMVNGKIKHSKSALFIVQQERAKIGVSFGPKKSTSGGMAPYFYSSHQVWLNMLSSIVKEVKKLKRKTGNKIVASVKKNKITGKIRDVNFDIYYDYGVDDLSSCVDFLVSSGYWKKKGTMIQAKGLDLLQTKTKLIREIEEKDLQKDLQRITAEAWLLIEDQIKLKRKRKYS